jgi:hypothetical protein
MRLSPRQVLSLLGVDALIAFGQCCAAFVRREKSVVDEASTSKMTRSFRFAANAA